ncbi:MAG TPA: flavodoxin family protein [Deltaproteobacteria bacterium]|nr:flavodoxin family protein [Deltaproteobacteria bacterium]
MKKLLAIIASPRKLGNCEIFSKEIFLNLGSGWELNLIRLPSLHIKPCRACYTCLFEKQKCPQKDDLQFVIDALVEADAYVIAAPTYFLGPNSSLKVLLDRGLSFYAHIDELWGKPSVAVAIAGIRGLEGYTKLGVESFAKLIYSDLRGSDVIYGALPGETLLDDGNKKKAKILAKALLGKKQEPKTPVCPVCGGDTFRILSVKRVRCMLCSNTWSLEIRGDGKVNFLPEDKQHHLFTSLDEAKAHADWLRGMKNLFLQKRKELKSVCLKYAREGNWLEPESEE